MAEWISAAEAARRLGIQPASLYSYVSRGVLARRRAADGRSSLFDSREVDELARRGKPRRRGGSELVIESAITEITGSRLRYRGLDVTDLARRRSFEEVAGLLWTGSFEGASGPWQAAPEAVAAGTAAQAGLPPETLPLERLQVVVPALAATDPLRLHLDPPAVAATARSLIAGMVECLPAAGQGGAEGGGQGGAEGGGQGGAGAGQDITARLALKLCPQPLIPGQRTALRAALVLLADHELAASTLAARVAASVRADPYAVVATGLGAVSGVLHGGASLGAEVMLRSAANPADAARVVGDLLRRGERIPGLGHFVYSAGDPRAAALLELLRTASPGSPALAVADAIWAEARRRALPEPNIDFALAALAVTAGMIAGAGEAIFAIARTAGWIAHALEEYARRSPIRPRSLYTGPAHTGG
jgi:citrate synthase